MILEACISTKNGLIHAQEFNIPRSSGEISKGNVNKNRYLIYKVEWCPSVTVSPINVSPIDDKH